MTKHFFRKSSLLGLLLLSSQAFSHSSVVPKDNLDAYSGRQYQEGTSGYININLSHGCSNEDGDTFATKNVTVVFPNSVNLEGVAYAEDKEGLRYGANALMGVKPRIDSDWRKIKRLSGDVEPYYSHSVKTTDMRSIHWLRGYVPNDMYEHLEFKASFPKLDNCVETLRVFIPVVQYCKKGNFKAWIKEPTPAFPEDVISVGYSPYIDVVRNVDTNPLPTSCSEGETVEVYPTEADVDRYLPLGRR